MDPLGRGRPIRDRRLRRIDVVCVVVVVVAVVALGVWIVTHAGGGVLNQG
jgi:autotransporter translocation and assembly factor TamB